MDDSILAEFQSAFLISGEVHDTHVQHPHYTLYKQKRGGFADQAVRRKKMLEDQKSRRKDYANYVRKIVEGEDLEDFDMDEGDENGVDEVDDISKSKEAAADKEAMQVTGSSKKKKRKLQYPYRNQLMLSEWLVDVPPDLEENWYMIVCPVGRRCLVVAARGTTSSYARAGNLLNNFPSLLPGGCAKTHRISRDYSIMDCIYHEGTRKFYVLDILCWRGHPVYDSDTEFRSYWTATKFREEASIASEYSRINPLTFHSLTYHRCTKDSVTKVLSEKQPYEVDGLLFIHKESHYNIGPCPLATWLKPKMLPDILKWPVSEEFLSSTSIDTRMETSQESGDGGRKSRRQRRQKQRNEVAMETTVDGDVIVDSASDGRMEQTSESSQLSTEVVNNSVQS